MYVKYWSILRDWLIFQFDNKYIPLKVICLKDFCCFVTDGPSLFALFTWKCAIVLQTCTDYFFSKKKGKLFPRKVFSNPFVTHDNNPTVITDLSKSFCQFKKCVILSFVIFIGGKISKENLIFFSNVLKMNEITVCQHFCLKWYKFTVSIFVNSWGWEENANSFRDFASFNEKCRITVKFGQSSADAVFLKLWKNKRVKKNRVVRWVIQY